MHSLSNWDPFDGNIGLMVTFFAVASILGLAITVSRWAEQAEAKEQEKRKQQQADQEGLQADPNTSDELLEGIERVLR